MRKKSAEYLKCRNRFNENLKSIMKEKGYTYRSLSISIEKNEGYISRLLRGKIGFFYKFFVLYSFSIGCIF